MAGRRKVKRVKNASESQDAKYPSQRLKVPKPPVPKGKIGRPRKDGGGQPIFDQFPPVRPAIPRRDAAPPQVSESGDQDGGPAIPRRDAAPPPISESGNQVGGPAVSPMVMRGRKTKVSRSRNKTPKKTPNGKKHKSKAKEDVSLTCDEDFNDLFTHTPNVATMKEVYGEVEEKEIEEREVEEEEVEEREVEEQEIEGGEVEEEEVEEREVEEQEIEEREVEAEEVEEREVEEEEVEGKEVEVEEVEGRVVEEEGV
ncbi:unnamed protein product [Lactuca virosa]|uniref:Uncharacterized protein n=1 Tax=Lactuca virosa TaxID=75947 RepID=A0AAU9NWE2_9ASTR|nr:unnamed protein product [Lactuca virosa]